MDEGDLRGVGRDESMKGGAEILVPFKKRKEKLSEPTRGGGGRQENAVLGKRGKRPVGLRGSAAAATEKLTNRLGEDTGRVSVVRTPSSGREVRILAERTA